MTRPIRLLYDTHDHADDRRDDNAAQFTNDSIAKLNAESVDFTVHGGDIRPMGLVTSPSKEMWGVEGWGEDNPYYEQDFPYVKDKLENDLKATTTWFAGTTTPRPTVQQYFPNEKYSPPDNFGRTDNYWGVEEINGIRYVYLNSFPTEGSHTDEKNQ